MKPFTKETEVKNKIRELYEHCQHDALYQAAKRVAKYDTMSVLITGETGTGKENLAHYIHDNSSRAEKPFVILNIAQYSGETLNSELFGHKKGSFTGAITNHKGFFKQADGGTIFLDEIGDIALSTQIALLRTLNDGSIRVGGGDNEDFVDVRVIAATNANIREKVELGILREDFYQRINHYPLLLTPFRDKTETQKRKSIDFLISKISNDFNGPRLVLADSAWQVLFNHNFKGNYRELENIINRLYVNEKESIEGSDITDVINEVTGDSLMRTCKMSSATSKHEQFVPITMNEHICVIAHNTFMACGNVKSDAACKLGIDTKTLNKYLAGYNSMVNNPTTMGINPIGMGEKVMGIN